MLTITVPGTEVWNEELDEFDTIGEFTLDLEHSLVSLSKWEQFYKKPFLTSDKKTSEEIFYYVQMMALTPNVPMDVWERLSEENIRAINEYIESKQTATWFNEPPGVSKRGPTITSELVYYWMFSLRIDKECEYWNLDRLFTLIRVFNAQTQSPKKINKADAIRQQRELNARRRAELGTRG